MTEAPGAPAAHAFLPPRAVVREVGLRDGLQSIARTLPTAHKLEWIRDAHAPGAGGNVDTEDLVFMLESTGVATGIDLPKLLDLRQRVAGWLDGETLQGTVWRAGFPKTFVATAGVAA